MTTATQTNTHTLSAPGATITYDVRAGEGSGGPPLFLVGSPMDAAGFGTLAAHFTDRTVVTYDPRGTGRSAKDEVADPVDPDIHADDLHRVIAAIGPSVDVFASSGGAVNALALVASHAEQVRTLVAHEPPLAAILPDAPQALAACSAVSHTYRTSGFGPGMAHFIALTSHEGPFGWDFAERPGPDPSMFGLPSGDDGSRADPLLGQNMITCTHYVPDLDALRTAATRIVIASGVESGEQLASRSAAALAAALGLEVTPFPGGHGGFLGGEYGQTGEPDAFAATLREVLG